MLLLLAPSPPLPFYIFSLQVSFVSLKGLSFDHHHHPLFLPYFLLCASTFPILLSHHSFIHSWVPVQINDWLLGVVYNLNLSHVFDPSRPLKKKLKKKKLSSLYPSLFLFQSWVLVFLPPKLVALTATPTTTQPPQPSITTAEREQNHKRRRRRRRRRRRQLRRNMRLRVIRDRPKRMRGIHISWDPKKNPFRKDKVGWSHVGSAPTSGTLRISTVVTRLESCWDTVSSGIPMLPPTSRVGIESPSRGLRRIR